MSDCRSCLAALADQTLLEQSAVDEQLLLLLDAMHENYLHALEPVAGSE